MVASFSNVWHRVTRKRPVDNPESSPNKSGVTECLSTVDLISLGVGSCCGTGMYLTCGMITQIAGGPGAMIAFVVSGIASLLSGMCYAELCSICPGTSGSAYLYSYITIGELIAYIIGWALITEYVIGTAAGAVALSATLDSLFNNSFSFYLQSWGAIGSRPYCDVVSAVICIAITMVLANGVKLSARLNNILNLINFIVWIIFIGISVWLSDSLNWTSDNLFPNGSQEILKMIPTAYYAFIGFDLIATTSSEAMNPTKSIPTSIIISVIICIVVFTSVSVCLSFMVPAMLLSPSTAMLDVFVQKGVVYAKYIVSVGAVCGLLAATFGSMFPLPRVLCSMAQDGLMISQFGDLCEKRKTPLTATLVSGVFSAMLALTVDLNYLIELVLMGTLLAYILVAFSVIILRYSNSNTPESVPPSKDVSEDENGEDEQSHLIPSGYIGEDVHSTKSNYSNSWCYSYFSCFQGCRKRSNNVPVLLCVICSVQIVMCVFIQFGFPRIVIQEIQITIMAVLVLVQVVVIWKICSFPQNRREGVFHIPFVPVLPLLVIFINIYLMIRVSPVSWMLFSVWMAIGIVMYMFFISGQITNEKQ